MIDACAVGMLLDWFGWFDDFDAVYCIGEALGETEAQYRSEVALYGDAWPGAAIQLANMKAAYLEAVKVADLLQALHPPVEPIVFDHYRDEVF